MIGRGFFPVLFFLLVFCSLAHAHKITAFAFIEAGKVTIEVRFSNNVPVIEPCIQCNDTATGKTVFETTGGKDGTAVIDAMKLSTLLTDDAGCEVVCRTADGHRATWTIYRKELPASTSGSNSVPDDSLDSAPEQETRSEQKNKSQSTTGKTRKTVRPHRPRQPGIWEAFIGVLLIMGCGALIQRKTSREKA